MGSSRANCTFRPDDHVDVNYSAGITNKEVLLAVVSIHRSAFALYKAKEGKQKKKLDPAPLAIVVASAAIQLCGARPALWPSG